MHLCVIFEGGRGRDTEKALKSCWITSQYLFSNRKRILFCIAEICTDVCSVSYSLRTFFILRCILHGWEIAVILRNFCKTKLSKSKFLFFFFFFFYFFFILFQHVHNVRLDDCFPAFYGTSPAKPPSSFAHAWYKHSDPGIRRGNEDSRENENRKWRKNFFSAENKFTSILCFLNSPSV